eukprot:TRINITY_DN23498_c0_g1_i1.p1 TRINITY_DN23498_c0_g1~~TRINITY_DN23498_c0_g1_i1.p1  ORF type:complete len:644 (-),score=116.92 TRINITY_DN23498_c0_g1_i1:109-2040(-)
MANDGAANGVDRSAAEGGNRNGREEEQEQDNSLGGFMARNWMHLFMMFMLFNLVKKPQQQNLSGPVAEPIDGPGAEVPLVKGSNRAMKNLFGPEEPCELFVHYHPFGRPRRPVELPAAAIRNQTYAQELGFELLWRASVVYGSAADVAEKNLTVGPLKADVLAGSEEVPHLYASLVRHRVEDKEELTTLEAVSQALPLVAKLRELDATSDTAHLLGSDGSGFDQVAEDAKQAAAKEKAAQANSTAAKTRLPYWKRKVDIRPIFDQTILNMKSVQAGPFRKLTIFPEEGYYQPMLYISDFWLLEKDYVPLNSTLKDGVLNLTLSYSIASLWVWSLQTQMAEQWMTQGEWGISDTQRDSFMLKRLVIDTNPYFLGFSGAFVALHSLFSLLAFKNDIQFWKNNKSMQGLSARSMCVGFVCQLITALYLLDSRETSRLILFELFLDLALAFWKLRKAVKIELSPQFPFLQFAGQTGYEESDTAEYDRVAIRYMSYIIFPCYVIYVIRSLFHDKYRSWYSFVIGNLAGGVYAFGFIMMTPQLYINYKLKSVEHLPWRALTYKAMNTFVDDIFAFLIDMPMMHRLSCFRDDIIFLIYCYQRWAYRVDKTRPSVGTPRLPAEPLSRSAGGAGVLTAGKSNVNSEGLRQRR